MSLKGTHTFYYKLKQPTINHLINMSLKGTRTFYYKFKQPTINHLINMSLKVYAQRFFNSYF